MHLIDNEDLLPKVSLRWCEDSNVICLSELITPRPCDLLDVSEVSVSMEGIRKDMLALSRKYLSAGVSEAHLRRTGDLLNPGWTLCFGLPVRVGLLVSSWVCPYCFPWVCTYRCYILVLLMRSVPPVVTLVKTSVLLRTGTLTSQVSSLGSLPFAHSLILTPLPWPNCSNPTALSTAKTVELLCVCSKSKIA